MFVRLAFAVIANVHAYVLVIDEALSVGDAFFFQKCMRFLRKFMEQGTILFVSHDVGAILNLCQRAILLGEGRIEAMGPSKDVTAKYIEQLYESQQGKGSVGETERSDNITLRKSMIRDMRSDVINRSQYRNDIEVFAFSPDARSLGKGTAEIVSAQLVDENDNGLSWVVGGSRGRRLFAQRIDGRPTFIVMFNDVNNQIARCRLGKVRVAKCTCKLTAGASMVGLFDGEVGGAGLR